MSASEKLRALAENGFTCEHWTDVDASNLDLTDELIAVVEAAERIMADLKPGIPEHDLDGESDLRAALTALDETLGKI